MAEVFDGLLVACPNDGGMFLFNRGVMHRLDDLDTTGLAVSGGVLVRALQPDRLAMLGTAARELEGAVGRFDDLHDVLPRIPEGEVDLERGCDGCRFFRQGFG